MNTQEHPSGEVLDQSYDSVSALMRGQGIPQAVQAKVAELRHQTTITLWLAQLRQAAGITQKEMADAMQVGQSTISKLEAGKDNDLTLGQILAYSKKTGKGIALRCGKPLTHAESIQIHADGLKFHLDSLAGLASQKTEMAGGIKKFVADTFYNLFKIMTLCSRKLPKDEEEDVRVQINEEITELERG
jgi:transcriptional regulator with XRE-family HTH domain